MNQYDVIAGTQYQGYAAPQVFSGAGQGIVIHQPQTGAGLDGVKEWLDKRSVGNIPNKYLVAGAAVAGILFYGYKDGWF